MIFSYEGYTRDGEKTIGTLEAEDERELKFLLPDDIIISKVRTVRIRGIKKVSDEELISFTRLLSTAVGASIPLTRGLEITYSELAPRSPLRSVIVSLLHQIKTGKNLSDALSFHRSVFSELYISMVKAGERSGKLGRTLDEALKYLQKAYETKRKISGALLYPGFIMSFAVVILIFFLTVLIPRFQDSYAQFGSEIPKLTLNLLNFTDWFKSHLLLIFLAFAGSIILMKVFIDRPKGRRIYENVLFHLPVVGQIYNKTIISRFTNTLGVLLSNGVTLVEALELCRGVLSNKMFEDTVERSLTSLKQGESFTKALRDNPQIPSILTQMTAMGEESGRLAELLSNLSRFYEKDVDVSIEKLTTLITPVMIIFIGVIVGFIVVALFLPIFNLSSVLGT